MIESSLLLSIRDVVPGIKPNRAPDSDRTRCEASVADDQVPSMWNFALFNAGIETKDRTPATAQSDAAGQSSTL